MNQAEVLEVLRAHPYSTIAELAETVSPKDRHEKIQRMSNLSNKLHHLKRFGLAATIQDEEIRQNRWYATEEA